MRIFLTGSTGFIGQALVRAMRRRDWAVAALVRDPNGAPAQWLARQGCTVVGGDVTRPQGLAQAMAGADAVVHNAGVYELGANAQARVRMQEVNVGGTDNVLGAASEAGIPRTVYVSTVWALGASGYPPEPAVAKDETQRHSGRYLSSYERTKADAHQAALAWRKKGLPLIIGMPNAVVGANDHAALGYFLRLYLLGAMPPIAWGGDTVFSMVDVDALAEGLCLATANANIGEDYVFAGEPLALRAVFEIWRRYPGGMAPRLFLPRSVMYWQAAMMEPLLRALGLPAFLSRDAVAVTRAHLNYSAAKARRDLGWSHPGTDDMWDGIIRRERDLMAQRRSFLAKLRHQPVT